MKMHVQCRLRRGATFQHVWLPEKFAQEGKFVKILDVDGWKVEEASTKIRLPSDWVRERSQDHKKMRSMTDI